MERCPSGLWYLPRKQANGLFRSVGSNPTLSVKVKTSSFSWSLFSNYERNRFMKAYRENKAVGNEMLPIQLYKIDIDPFKGTSLEVISGFGTEVEKSSFKSTALFPQWHSYIEIIYIVEGSASIQINKHYFSAKEGDFILIDAFDIHSLEGKCKQIVLLMDIMQMPHLKDQNHKMFPVKEENKRLTNTEGVSGIHNKLVKSLKFMVDSYDKKQSGYYYDILSIIYDILGSIQKYKDEINEDTIAKTPISEDGLKKLNLIFEYISKNYTEAITLEEVADLVGLSTEYLCRFFKKAMGKTLLEYLNYYRCSKAEVLLQTTSKSITEIALDVGFSSVSYFDRIYKRIKGNSPSKTKRAV